MRKLLSSLKEAGQTSLEYMLLIAVMAGLSLTFFKKMEDYFIKNPNSMINQRLKVFGNTLGSAENYERFRIP